LGLRLLQEVGVEAEETAVIIATECLSVREASKLKKELSSEYIT